MQPKRIKSILKNKLLNFWLAQEKIEQIEDQLKQFEEKGKYWDHYEANIKRIIWGVPIIDYRVIRHGNLIVHDSSYHQLVTICGFPIGIIISQPHKES